MSAELAIPPEVAALVAAAAAPPPGSAPGAALYSIKEHFGPDAAVLLTGATGYIGSLVLEKLLRSTAVGRVYVLVRARRGQSPADRLGRVLKGPLFHLLTEADTARVTAVSGDINSPGMGLSPEDEAMLVASVDTVLHSAAGEAPAVSAHARARRRHAGGAARGQAGHFTGAAAML